MWHPVWAAGAPRVNGLPLEAASPFRAAIGENWRRMRKMPLNLYRLQSLTYRAVPFNKEAHAMDGYTTQTSLSAAQNRSEVAPSAGKAAWAAGGGVSWALCRPSCWILPAAHFRP